MYCTVLQKSCAFVTALPVETEAGPSGLVRWEHDGHK